MPTIDRNVTPRPLSSAFLVGLLSIAGWFVVRSLMAPAPPIPALYASIGFSIAAFVATLYLVPTLGPTFVKAKLFGLDLLKVHKIPMCEQNLLALCTAHSLKRL
jgi:UDP-N-acetylglucosamine--dolichyl-phosphate N-acetylglucosaminephosphotransferase